MWGLNVVIFLISKCCDDSLCSVLHNSEVEGKFPILSEYMQMKTLVSDGEGKCNYK